MSAYQLVHYRLVPNNSNDIKYAYLRGLAEQLAASTKYFELKYPFLRCDLESYRNMFGV